MLNSSDSGSGSGSSSRLDLDLDDADSYEDEDEGSFSNFVGSDGIESSFSALHIGSPGF